MTSMNKKRLMRPTEGRMMAGVAAGLARYFGIDATLVRIGFAVLTLLGFGTSFLAYLVLWVVMPDQAKLADEEWEDVPAFEGEIAYEGPSSLGDDVHEAVEDAVTQAAEVDKVEPAPHSSSLGSDVQEAVEQAVGRATDGNS